MFDRMFSQFVDCLHAIMPPTGVLHVGAGVDDARRYCDWGVAHVVLVEADKEKAKALKQEVPTKAGWHVVQAVVAAEAKASSFYSASNACESGLLAPSLLTPLWKNLKSVAETIIEATTPTDILAQYDTNHQLNWLVIDCFPAASLLSTLHEKISQFDVICARIVLNESLSEEGVSKQALDVALNDHHFQCSHVEESAHPSVGCAIFMRDWKKILNKQQVENQSLLAQIMESNNKHEEVTHELIEKNRRMEQLTIEVDELKKTNAQLQSSHEEFVKKAEEQQNNWQETLKKHQEEKAHLQSQQESLSGKIKMVTNERDEINLRLNELQQSHSALNTKCQTFEQSLNALQEEKLELQKKAEANIKHLQSTTAELDAKNKQFKQLTIDADELKQRNAQLQSSHEEFVKKAEEQQNNWQNSEQKLEESHYREQLFDQEMIKAEAQIELIKDILIREKVF